MVKKGHLAGGPSQTGVGAKFLPKDSSGRSSSSARAGVVVGGHAANGGVGNRRASPAIRTCPERCDLQIARTVTSRKNRKLHLENHPTCVVRDTLYGFLLKKGP